MGSCSRRIAGSSGRNLSAKPVSTKNHRPALGDSTVISLFISSRIRSAETISKRSLYCLTASTNSGTGFMLKRAINRAARIIRNGSSLKLMSGSRGVRKVRVIKSLAPLNGSTNVGESLVSSRAIALIVKSRRDKSISMASENSTSGLRVSG